ncbi:MAG: hypothetical protein V1887_02015 [Candidatus Aenigmatarchaeota archaeon]
MKCYKHPKVNAVGVCRECGEGICKKCSVEIGGKLYCKGDADKVFGTSKAQAQAAPAATNAPQKPSPAMRNGVLGTSSAAWFLAIIGLFIFPPVCWGLGAILGYSAVTKASNNLNVFSKRDVAVCGIGALINTGLFFWWAIQLVDIISLFT